MLLLIINKGEITGAVDIDNMYEFASLHCTDFKDLRDDEDIVINREWIINCKFRFIGSPIPLATDQCFRS